MFGIDMIDLVPAGTIEDMVRANGADLVQMVMHAMRAKYELGPDERMSFQFIETEKDGKPRMVILPMVLDRGLVLVRKLPYFDVADLLRTVPIANYITEAKKVKKVVDQLEVLVTKLTAATAAADTAKADAVLGQIQKLVATIPPAMVDMLGLDHLLPAAPKPAVALPPAPEQLQLTAATGTGDTPAITKGTDEAPDANE